MPDVVVTVPKTNWAYWLAEGDLPGAPSTGRHYEFYLGRLHPRIEPGERVYIVAGNRLRGWAPLVAVRCVGYHLTGYPQYALVRGAGALACTLDGPVPGFRGFRYRWWDYQQEREFPTWQNL